jgi:hypothetical protein
MNIRTEILQGLVVAPSSRPRRDDTLPIVLGVLLDDIEVLFGTRDERFTILGIEFADGGPRLWHVGGYRVVIQLGISAMGDRARAEFQLAHECVHLLDPITAGEGTVLEEGLATCYSLQYIWREMPNYETGSAKYDAACSLAMTFLEDAPHAIKELRASGKRISELTSQDLLQATSSLTTEDASALAMRFASWEQ